MIGQAIPVTVVAPSAGALEDVRVVTPAEVKVTVAARERAAEAAGSGHLAFVGDGVRLAPGWLDGLIAAVGDDGTVATVEAIVLPEADEDGAARVRAAAGRAWPRQDAPGWRCTLVTRAALDVAGPLDDGFAARCSGLGLVHVVAGDVAVEAEEAPEPPDEQDALARARWRAHQLCQGLAVTVDARILRHAIAGTQVHTLELLAALHRTGAARLRVLLPPDPHPTARALLDGLDGLERLDSSTLDSSTPATAIVHRPYQVSGDTDLPTLRQVGTRLVVTHQDLLNFHVPAYHENEETWHAHRRLTLASLRVAHRVVAFSEHAGRDLLAEELVREERLRVVHIGVDHTLASLAPDPRAPESAATLGDRPYLLCLGSDLAHKNRPFAIALLRALRARHGWDGTLVLAGPHAQHGSSRAEEERLLAADPELARHVVDGGVPDEAEKAWLYANAAAAVYPTLYEGFGLVPFEAADHRTPCLFAAQAALVETLGDAARLVPWDADASADRAAPVLTLGTERDALVAAVRRAAAELTWDRTATALIGVYEEALGAAPADDASWATVEAEARRGHWEGMYWALRNEVGPTGLALVGADGLLPEPSKRALAALARRPATRRPLLGLLTGLNRLTGGSGDDGRP